MLALLDLRPSRPWRDALNLPHGVTPLMNWVAKNYGKVYAPNSRETFRRQTLHQFMAAGLVLLNPDNPRRAINSADNVYQIAPEALALLRTFGSGAWQASLANYRAKHVSLAEQYARARAMARVSIVIDGDAALQLSPGAHSDLIKAIIEQFAPRYAPGGRLVYAGDTGQKHVHTNTALLERLGLSLDPHGKMPDVIVYDEKRNWLLLVEAVTSHGPVDGKRHGELTALFAASKAPLVYVTAFPSRQVMARYVAEIAWETEVWVAEAPDHLVHFNGDRYLGPHL